MSLPIWSQLYLLSIKLGVRYLLSFPKNLIRFAATRVLVPMDIARYFEIPQTAQAILDGNPKSILDISSPKLLAVFLATQNKKVTATDIWDEEIKNWQELFPKNKNITWKVTDGRKLPFKDSSFDAAYSISVLEHIEGKGDTAAVRELTRVLKPGGRLIITVPVSQKGYELYKSKTTYGETTKNGKVFWARRYSLSDLHKKLIKPSGLTLLSMTMATEKYPFFSYWHSLNLPWSGVLGLLYPFVAAISLKISYKFPSNQTVGNILLVFEKSA